MVWLKFIKIRRRNMENLFLTVDEVRQLLGVSKSYAYKVIRKMNSELRQQGYHTIAGRVSKTYFLEKVKYQKLERSK
jgi:transcriptional antiterminator